MLFLARTRQGERNVRCSAGCRCQGVVCVWVTDWLTVPVPGYSKLYVLLYSVLFSRLNSFPAFVFSLRLQPLRCIPRATSICSFWDFGLLSGWVWVQVGLGYHDHDIAQGNKKNNNTRWRNKQIMKQTYFSSSCFFIIMSFFLTSFLLFYTTFLGVVVFFSTSRKQLRFITKHLKFSTWIYPFFL